MSETRDRHLRPVNDPDDADNLGRTPPQDAEAERSVLGGMLLAAHVIPEVTAILDGPDFYRPNHETIYDAIVDLAAAGEPADPVTVSAELHRRGQLARIGGPAYLHTLISQVPTAANAAYYAEIVRDRARLRRLAETGTRITQLAYADGANPDTAEQAAADHLERTRKNATHPTDDPTSWVPVDLAGILDGTHHGPTATILTRRDGKALLYPGAVHSASGEPGSGKTWLALVAVAQELNNNHDALFIDFEDRPETIVNRLRGLAVPDQAIAKHLRYIRPDTALTPTSRQQLEQAADQCTIAIIDGITEAMTLHGLSLMDNEDVARWLALIPRVLADQGLAVLQIDHVVKNSDARGRYAIGGQHKLAGITGVAFKMLTIRSFGKGTKGHAKLVIDKDKHGDVGPNGATAADLHFDATDPHGALYAWLDAGGPDRTDDGQWRPTGYMEKVSRFLEQSPGSAKSAIEKAIRGKAEHIRAALETLINEGHVRTEDGPRGAIYCHLLTPFREDDE